MRGGREGYRAVTLPHQLQCCAPSHAKIADPFPSSSSSFFFLACESYFQVGFHALRSFARPPLRVDLAYVYNIDAEMEAGLVAGGKVQICSLTLLA